MSKHKKLFTSSGYWTCPAGVSIVTLISCGGGGGGGGGEDGVNGFTRTQCSGGGGGGAQTQRVSVAVTPNVIYQIGIGAGGAGGARAAVTASNGSDGGDGYFKINGGATLATFVGASHGRGGDSTQSRFTSGGMPIRGYRKPFKIDLDNLGTWVYSRFFDQTPGSGGGGFDYNGFAGGYDGDPSFQQLAGVDVGGGTGGAAGGDGTTSGAAANGRGAGGGGCSNYPSSVGGAGGNGGNAAAGAGLSGGNATSGSAGTGYGAGGGGGGMGGNKEGAGTAGQGGNGGAGSSGFLQIEWET